MLDATEILATGSSHTCAIFAPGAVRCWGDNSAGQLGQPPAGDPLGAYSVDLGRGQRARSVFAGPQTTCVILDDGSVKCWGENSHGQLGLGDTTTRGDGTSAMGDSLPFVQLGDGERAASLALGGTASCALLETGRVKCWGDAYQGALGYGDNVERGSTPGTMGDALPAVDLGTLHGAPSLVKELAAVDYHSFCAILNDTGSDNSALKCWGSNDYCELGAGTRQAGLADMAETVGDNMPWVDLGTTARGTKRKAAALAGGYQFVCVLSDDAAVKCWGDNGSGQLGLGYAGPSVSCRPDEIGNQDWVGLPAPAVDIAARGESNGGGAHACALLENGEVRCWGENGFGQLGTGDTTGLTVASAPLVFPDGFVPRKLVMGDQHSCAISSDGRIKCWGSDQKGQLGPPATGDVHSPGPDLELRSAPVSALAAGDDHTCALLESGAIKCWGRNVEGQLGVGDTVDRGVQPDQMGASLPAVDLGGGATAVSAGALHTCAVLATGGVKCWGANDSGELGTGDTSALLAPASSSIALGGPASALALGSGFSCALLASGAIKCWGRNDVGQLGMGDLQNRLAPARSVVPIASRAAAIAAGAAHACALLADGRLQCWGANDSGQLGVGDDAPRATPTTVGLGETALAISARGNQSCVLLSKGRIRCWGDNAHGQLGLGDAVARSAPDGAYVDLGNARTASAVAAGAAFTCALLDRDEVKCWGDNSVAELGTSLTGTAYGDAPGELGDSLPVVFQGGGRSVRAIAAGAAHVCAILDTADVRCWGDNTHGQLGAGDSAAHSVYSSPTATVDLGHGA